MPRASVLLTATPVDAQTVVRAAGEVWARGGDPAAEAFTVRALDDGAVLQVLSGDVAIVSVLRPRLLPVLDEVERLLPGASADPARVKWWTDAYTPWQPAGAVGLAILEAAAALAGGHVVDPAGPRPGAAGPGATAP